MEMAFNGQFQVPMPKTRLYGLLSDPEKVIPLLPNHKSMDRIGENTYRVKLAIGIGAIRGTSVTQLSLVELNEPHSAVYHGGGTVMQGRYSIRASFELEEEASSTLVKWNATTALSGKILSLAGGGLRGYAEKEINRTINGLLESLSGGAIEEKTRWYHFLRSRKRRPERRAPPAEYRVPTALAEYPQEFRDRHHAQLAPIRKLLDVGRSERKLGRKEDFRLIRGAGLFVDDYDAGGMLHMALVRSPFAHAKIKNIDLSALEDAPDVVCTLTGREVSELSSPFMQIGPEPGNRIKDYCLAVDEVRYQGEPVVAIVARSVHAAADAVLEVNVEYEPLPVVVEVEEAVADQILIHEDVGTNCTWEGVYEYGDVDAAFAEAAHIVKIDRLHFHRFSSTALETNAVVAAWDKRGELDILCNTIMAIPIMMIANALGLTTDAIRLRTHDVGGSFGNKNGNYPYITLACLASRKANGRPVKWVETRSEHMQTGGQGAERIFRDTEVALDENGVITALRSRHLDDCGAFPRYEPLGCVVWSQVLPGAYRARNFRIEFSQFMTHRSPCAPNRGYSRLQHLWFMERVIDICGYELGLDSDEIRRRNYITQFPYTTPNGCVYDSGDFVAMLEKGKEVIGWDTWLERKERESTAHRRIGLGIGTSIDSGTNSFSQARIINPHLPFSGNSQVAIVKIDLDGTVSVAIGSFPQGQGHETTAAQVASRELGISDDYVNVKTGFDSARNTVTGTCGTYASQFAVTGLSAVHGAVVKLKKEMKLLAAFVLEANESDLEFGQGDDGPELRVVGTRQSVTYRMLANFVNYDSASLPPELRELSLNIRHVYMAPFDKLDVPKRYGNLTLTYAIQIHLAVVELDMTTAHLKILDYVIVDDCGTVINKMIVEGQTHGAAAHGIGATILETMPYDNEGNIVNGSFTDYVPITIMNMPDMKNVSFETPSPFTYNGAKGMGEGGGTPIHTIGAALQNALHDKGIIITNSHNAPSALFETINGASHSEPGVVVKTEARRASVSASPQN